MTTGFGFCNRCGNAASRPPTGEGAVRRVRRRHVRHRSGCRRLRRPALWLARWRGRALLPAPAPPPAWSAPPRPLRRPSRAGQAHPHSSTRPPTRIRPRRACTSPAAANKTPLMIAIGGIVLVVVVIAAVVLFAMKSSGGITFDPSSISCSSSNLRPGNDDGNAARLGESDGHPDHEDR